MSQYIVRWKFIPTGVTNETRLMSLKKAESFFKYLKRWPDHILCWMEEDK